MNKTRLFVLTAVMLLIHTITFAQQFATIKGTVTTSDGKPAAYISVGLKGKGLGNVTNDKGLYEILRVKPGSYTIRVSAVGMQNLEKTITLTAGESKVVDFVISQNANQLSEININQGRTNRYVTKKSEYVSKMPLNNLENPQVYNTVDKAILADQLVFSVDDATRNIPGLQKMWEPTGRGGDGGSFYSVRGFTAQSALRNGVAGLVTGGIDAVNLERLEVLKGPSGTLFGSALTSYGGAINRVTKKPFFTTAGEVNVGMGSSDFSRVSVDFNKPLDSNIAFRINAAYNYINDFQGVGYDKSFAIAPSLLFKITKKLTLSLDAEIFNTQGTGKQAFFFYYPTAALGASSPAETKLDYNQPYRGDGLLNTSRSTNFFAQADYKFSDHFTSSTVFTSSHSFSNGYGPYFYLLPDNVVTGNPADAGKSNYLVRADQSTERSKSQLYGVQQNFNADFNIGSLRNRTVIGFDFFRKSPTINFNGINQFDIVPLNVAGFDYSQFNGSTVAQRYIQQNMAPPYIVDVKTNIYGAYVSDVLNITDKLMALAALRYDYFDNKGGLEYSPVEPYAQKGFSPKFGLVYQPIKDQVSIFANYQNSFTNKGAYRAMVNGSLTTAIAKLERANQIEGGVKLDAFNGKLSSTISYYNIKVENVLRADPSNPANAQIQDGTQLSKGVEVDIMANPVNGLNINAGFAYNDSKYTEADADVINRRPATAMSPYLANFFISYRFTNNALNGLGFGFGGNYASSNKIVNSVSMGVYTLPSYTVLNASAFYDLKRIRFSAKVDNLTDEKYWIGYTTQNPQRLRTYAGSITYKF